ncbi:hypothetical protein PDQ37_25445 [Bacillus cereus]|nr:hypothetical protein [Bacillus cereus]
MRFEIKCLCGMNILASLVEKEFENEGPVTSVLPIIATEDNGIGGIMVSAEETAEMDWSKVSFVGQEGN